MGSREVEKMVLVGVVWGTTNALMRRGALLWDHALQSNRTPGRTGFIRRWLGLLLIWQYTVPFLLNLSASAAFFAILGSAPISIAVPVTNATTFAATAVAGIVLGEETRAGLATVGTILILAGVYVCIV